MSKLIREDKMSKLWEHLVFKLRTQSDIKLWVYPWQQLWTNLDDNLKEHLKTKLK